MNATINYLLDQLAIARLALIERRIAETEYDAEVIRVLDAIEKERG